MFWYAQSCQVLFTTTGYEGVNGKFADDSNFGS